MVIGNSGKLLVGNAQWRVTGANRAGPQKSARTDRCSGIEVVYTEKTQAVLS